MTSPLSKEQARELVDALTDAVGRFAKGDLLASNDVFRADDNLIDALEKKPVVSDSPLDIAAIRARCEAATPGPWKGIRKTGYVYASDCVTARCGDFRDKELVPFNGERWGNDATFIAHAREDVPALCDALSTAIAERNKAWDNAAEWEMEAAGFQGDFLASQERVRELEKDAARIDWLGKFDCLKANVSTVAQGDWEYWQEHDANIRVAIDAEMSALSPDTQRETT